MLNKPTCHNPKIACSLHAKHAAPCAPRGERQQPTLLQVHGFLLQMCVSAHVILDCSAEI